MFVRKKVAAIIITIIIISHLWNCSRYSLSQGYGIFCSFSGRSFGRQWDERRKKITTYISVVHCNRHSVFSQVLQEYMKINSLFQQHTHTPTTVTWIDKIESTKEQSFVVFTRKKLLKNSLYSLFIFTNR